MWKLSGDSTETQKTDEKNLKKVLDKRLKLC